MSSIQKSLFCKIIESTDTALGTKLTKIYSNTNILSSVWFVLSNEKLLDYIISYNEYLVQSSIKTPILYKVEIVTLGIAMTQEIIVGTNLRASINDYYHEDRNKFIFYFEKLVKMQAQAYANCDKLRIDLNPDNYIVDSSENIYLVDITPPLYLTNIASESENILIQRYLDLCFNICTQIAELINNFIRPMIKNKEYMCTNASLEDLNAIIDKLILLAIKAWSNSDMKITIQKYFDQLLILEKFSLKSDSYPLKRLWLVKKLCKNKISKEDFYIEYNHLSLTKAL